MDFLSHFPYPEPREIQKQVLEILQNQLPHFDVFVISAPTAFGKTGVAKSIQNACKSVSVITPNNLLVSQFLEEFPETKTLARLDSYRCEDWQTSCSSVRSRKKQFCKGCPAGTALATAKYRRGPGTYNYHTYLAHKLFRNVLVVDEAHNLIPQIRERNSLRMWHHKFKYPLNSWTKEKLVTWIEGLKPSLKKNKMVQILLEACTSKKPRYSWQRAKQEFNGVGTLRGEPELRDCILLLPTNIRDAPPIFWPGLGREGGEVQKLVLLSATIGRKDIQTLGLDRKRVLYLDCESPIPSQNRPIYFNPISYLSSRNLDEGTREIAKYIQDVLGPRYPGQKGIIHATYQQATILAEYLGASDRYLFHDRTNRSEVYSRFREMSPESGAVLIASGMYEGIDLEGNLGRWQVIAKLPWANLGNPAVQYLQQQDPEWYNWETWKLLIQACGRICRTPTDHGDTYILDSSFSRLLRESSLLAPKWWLDALVLGGDAE